ncbi:hypothetical protein KDA23_05425 [Candidatus Saccharibacteria bacterium]|nr:hypothetical protein [Candidatus Saccharibacteria bacterium]
MLDEQIKTALSVIVHFMLENDTRDFSVATFVNGGFMRIRITMEEVREDG